MRKMNIIKKKVLVVFGTRPETIKMAPVIKELEKAASKFELIICVTGQHRHILDQMLSIFNIRPHVDLNLMQDNQSLSSLTSRAVLAVSKVIEEKQPDICLVQGDTTTAMVAGLASFYYKVPVGHVEAGLRTNNKYNPFPEEINRRLLSTLTTYHFAPTDAAVRSLLAEGIDKEDIYLTGNTVIDAFLMIAARNLKPKVDIGLKQGRFILVTAHRRENFGVPIRNICKALRKIVRRNDIQIVYPVHPNPNVQLPVYEELAKEKSIYLIPPLEYEDFVFMMKNCYLVLTDSGGVQEEAPSLGKPVLVMRETTERPEAVEAGVARLVGTETYNIVAEVEHLLHNQKAYEQMARSTNPFGDGKAAKRIVQVLEDRLF